MLIIYETFIFSVAFATEILFWLFSIFVCFDFLGQRQILHLYYKYLLSYFVEISIVLVYNLNIIREE